MNIIDKNKILFNNETNITNSYNDLLYDILNIMTTINNNINFIKLIEFIKKYNLVQDKISDIYSYYDYYDNNIKINIILLEGNYIYSFNYKRNDYVLNVYEIFMNINSNVIYTKCITDKNNKFYYNKFNDDYIRTISHIDNNENFYNIFQNISEKYIVTLNENILNYIKLIDISKYFNYTKIGNITCFDTYYFKIIYKDKIQYIYKFANNIINIKYNDNYLADISETFSIEYIKDNNTHLIQKKIIINNKKCFDSEIYINGFVHKINKLNYNFDGIIIKSKELPYFLFDNNTDKNLLIVYANNEPCVYEFIVNILNENMIPNQYIYNLDNNGELFSKKTIKENDVIIDYYKSGIKIKSEEYLKCNLFYYIKNKPDYDYDFKIYPTSLDFKSDIFNKELIIINSDYVYKFIINFGITGSKQVENITVVVEDGANTQDISKIILKQDGSVEIIRTNNNNQLIVKSSTRNKFEGNIGYKFAITGNIPCVVTLNIPDDSEVVFDHYHNKFRCNKCIVQDIRPILNRNVKEIENKCGICIHEIPNVMFDPCQHVICNECINSVITNNKCYICNTKINSYIIMKQDLVNDKIQIEKANSAIYSSDFEYKIGETIIVDNFDIRQYWKCSAGIYFHNKIEDVYNWLEFIEIPKNLKI